MTEILATEANNLLRALPSENPTSEPWARGRQSPPYAVHSANRPVAASALAAGRPLLGSIIAAGWPHQRQRWKVSMKPTKRNTRSSTRSGKRASPVGNRSAKATTKPKAAGPNGNGSKAMAVATAGNEVTRHTQALSRLHVSPEALAKAPPITPILQRAHGGMKVVLAGMRLAQDEVISTFLEKYDTVSASDREILPLEAIALAAGVDPHHLLAATILALDAQSIDISKVIYATAYPAVAEARIENALKAGGHQDRNAIDTMRGHLPSARNTFIGKATAIFGSGREQMDAQNAGRGGTIEADVDDGDRLLPLDELNEKIDDLFPSPSIMQEKLTPIRQRQLSDGEAPVSHWSDDDRAHVQLDRKRSMHPEQMTPEEWERWAWLEKHNAVFK